MSMTKEQFFEEISQLLTPTEAEIETQYYWEMARRRQFYIDHITEQIMAMPESHWFSADFEAWMYEKQKEEESKLSAQMLVEKRNEVKPKSDTFSYASGVLSDSEWEQFVESLPPLTLTAEEVEELKRRQANDE